MAFCTQLEWDRGFDLAQYQAMAEKGMHGGLPSGCLARIVGQVDGGTRIFEVWESSDDARRFGESSAPLLSEYRMPPPSRSAAYELAIFETSSS